MDDQGTPRSPHKYAPDFLLSLQLHPDCLRSPEGFPDDLALELMTGSPGGGRVYYGAGNAGGSAGGGGGGRMAPYSPGSAGGSMGDHSRRPYNSRGGLGHSRGGYSSANAAASSNVSSHNNGNTSSHSSAGRAWRGSMGRSAGDDKERLRREFTSLLNKLTLENFQRVVPQMLAILPANTTDCDDPNGPHALLLKLIIHKAVEEPKFSELYALLCRELVVQLAEPVGVTDAHPRLPIRHLLLNQLQGYFVQRRSPTFSGPAVSGWSAEELELRRRRYLVGLMTLIAYLLVYDLLTLHVVARYIMGELLYDRERPASPEANYPYIPHEDDLDASLIIMRTVRGSKKNTAAITMRLQELYLARLEFLAKQGYSSRLRFAILDMLEAAKPPPSQHQTAASKSKSSPAPKANTSATGGGKSKKAAAAVPMSPSPSSKVVAEPRPAASSVATTKPLSSTPVKAEEEEEVEEESPVLALGEDDSVPNKEDLHMVILEFFDCEDQAEAAQCLAELHPDGPAQIWLVQDACVAAYEKGDRERWLLAQLLVYLSSPEAGSVILPESVSSGVAAISARLPSLSMDISPKVPVYHQQLMDWLQK